MHKSQSKAVDARTACNRFSVYSHLLIRIYLWYYFINLLFFPCIANIAGSSYTGTLKGSRHRPLLSTPSDNTTQTTIYFFISLREIVLFNNFCFLDVGRWSLFLVLHLGTFFCCFWMVRKVGSEEMGVGTTIRSKEPLSTIMRNEVMIICS